MKKTVMVGLAMIMAAALVLIGAGCTSKPEAKGGPGAGTTVADKGKTPGGKTPGETGKTPGETGKAPGETGKTPEDIGKTSGVEPGKTAVETKTGEGVQPGATAEKKSSGPEFAYEKKSGVKPPAVKAYSYTVENDTKGLARLKIERKVDGDDRVSMKVFIWEDKDWKETSGLINDGKNTFLLTIAAKSALKSPLEKNKASIMVPKSMLFVPKWDNYQYDMLGPDSRVAKVGPDKLGDAEVTKYKVDGLPGVAMSAFVWVDKDGVIHQIEGQDDAGATAVSLKINQADLNPKLSDDDFKVPSDYNVIDATAPPPGSDKTPGKTEGDKKSGPEKAPEKAPEKEEAPK